MLTFFPLLSFCFVLSSFCRNSNGFDGQAVDSHEHGKLDVMLSQLLDNDDDDHNDGGDFDTMRRSQSRNSRKKKNIIQMATVTVMAMASLAVDGRTVE